MMTCDSASLDDVRLGVAVGVGLKEAVLFPVVVPLGLDVGRLVGFAPRREGRGVVGHKKRGAL